MTESLSDMINDLVLQMDSYCADYSISDIDEARNSLLRYICDRCSCLRDIEWTEPPSWLVAIVNDYLENKKKEEKSEPTIEVTFDILRSHYAWDKYCDKYGVNPWCINEGLGDENTKFEIKLSDFKEWIR